MIKIAGLGPGQLKNLPLGVYEEIKNSKIIYARTLDHPIVNELEKDGITFNSFDNIYKEETEFIKVYERIVDELEKLDDVLYLVPGHPMLAEMTIQIIINRNLNYKIIGGQSFLDVLFEATKIDPIEGFMMIDASDVKEDSINRNFHIAIPQVYSQLVASDLKLTLLEVMDPEEDIYILKALGTFFEEVKCVKVFELDHDFEIDNLTTIFIKKQNKKILS